jgi:uncharacterized membrane protein YdjX (TVP38/TMEM64 family)
MLANIPLVSSVLSEKENLLVRLTQKQFTLILKISAALIGAGLMVYFREPMGNALSVIGDREAVALYLNQFGILAPFLLSIVLVLQVVVAAIPGHALVVGGGYVFGFIPALCLSLAMTVLGSQLSFLLARKAGRPLVEKLAPVEVLDKWYEISAQKGTLFFTVAFMLPIFPADIMNYIAGLSSLSTRRFFVANLIGRLPGVVVMTAVGAFGFQLSPIIWVGVAVVGGVMFAGWRFVLGRNS